MIQTTIKSLLLIAALFITASFTETAAQGILVNYDFASASGPNCTAQPLTTAVSITSEFSSNASSCATPKGIATVTPPAYMANAKNQAISVQSSDITPSYFQIKLTGETLAAYSSYRVHLQAQRSGNAPVTGVLQYSTDGTTFTDFQSFAVGDQFESFVFDLSAVPSLDHHQTVYFRAEARTEDRSSGNFRIDNLQVSGELAPSSATARISGRAVTAKGAGLAQVTVILVGSGIEEPLYASSDSAGRFEFVEIPVGHTYIVMVSSGRYVFDQSSMVVNLTDNFDEAFFIGEIR